jgi:predicted MFS family arabinose efflux permease
VNSAIPVAWSAWLTKAVADEPESGGGLMVGAIQLSIMVGASLGGSLLDHFSIAATLIGGAVLLGGAALSVGNGSRVKPPMSVAERVNRQRLDVSEARAHLQTSEQCS